MGGETLRRPMRAWLSTLASGCALAVALMLMAMADGTTPLANPAAVINLGGPAPNHQGAGNAMFPPPPSRHLATSPPSGTTPAADAPLEPTDANVPQLVASIVPDDTSVTTTTTTTTTTTVPRRGGRGVESTGGGSHVGSGSGSGSTVPTTTTVHHRRVHRVRRPPRHRVTTPKPRQRPEYPKPKPPQPQHDPVSLGVRECPQPGDDRVSDALPK